MHTVLNNYNYPTSMTLHSKCINPLNNRNGNVVLFGNCLVLSPIQISHRFLEQPEDMEGNGKFFISNSPRVRIASIALPSYIISQFQLECPQGHRAHSVQGGPFIINWPKFFLPSKQNTTNLYFSFLCCLFSFFLLKVMQFKKTVKTLKLDFCLNPCSLSNLSQPSWNFTVSVFSSK